MSKLNKEQLKAKLEKLQEELFNLEKKTNLNIEHPRFGKDLSPLNKGDTYSSLSHGVAVHKLIFSLDSIDNRCLKYKSLFKTSELAYKEQKRQQAKFKIIDEIHKFRVKHNIEYPFMLDDIQILMPIYHKHSKTLRVDTYLNYINCPLSFCIPNREEKILEEYSKLLNTLLNEFKTYFEII